MTIDELVNHLKTATTRVDVALEYSHGGVNSYKEKTHEYGVRLRILTLGQLAKDGKYPSLHFHVLKNQSGTAPQLSAHFKTGQSKGANQGLELKVWDGFALYLLCQFSQPVLIPAKGQGYTTWKPLQVRVTDKMMKQWIDKKDLHSLRSIYLSKVTDLSFWEPEAWSRLLHSGLV